MKVDEKINNNVAEEYKTTRREVLSEMYDGVRSKFTKENASKVGKSLSSIIMTYAAGTTIISGMPYAIPTYARILKENKKTEDDIELNTEKVIGRIGAIITGTLYNFGQSFIYTSLAREDHPEFLLMPVATNVASGVYEIGRKMYSNAKERVLEKHKAEALEARLKTTKPAQESFPNKNSQKEFRWGQKGIITWF